MKRIYLVLVVIANFGCSSTFRKQDSKPAASASPTITLSRYLKFKTCHADRKDCIGPIAIDLEKANIELVLKEFFKGDGGLTAQNLYETVKNGISFKSEIRVIKKPNAEGYFFYMMLRSGPGLKREGKVKTFSIKDLSQLTETIVSDSPIKFDGGTLQAELVLGPSLKLPR
jgi:hypothetical protein